MNSPESCRASSLKILGHNDQRPEMEVECPVKAFGLPVWSCSSFAAIAMTETRGLNLQQHLEVWYLLLTPI